MSNWIWVRIRSWHVLVGANTTLCGRHASAGAETTDTLPAGKSCESCLRSLARREDT